MNLRRTVRSVRLLWLRFRIHWLYDRMVRDTHRIDELEKVETAIKGRPWR